MQSMNLNMWYSRYIFVSKFHEEINPISLLHSDPNTNILYLSVQLVESVGLASLYS